MPYPAKLTNLSALLVGTEATYGTAATLAATSHGTEMALSDRQSAVFTANHLYNGELGPAPGNLGMLKRVGAVGRTASGTIPMRFRGAGTTYTATVLPNLHTMLKIGGFDSTLSSGSYTYTPTADSLTYSSATMELYQRGEKWTLTGGLCSVGFDIGAAGVPLWQFETQGILSTAIADSAVAVPTYLNTTVGPPVAAGVTFTIGSYSARLKSASFRMGRVLTERPDLTATDAHQGFVPAGYDPEFRCTVEVPALTYPNSSSGIDPYKMKINAEEVAIALTVGGTAYNRFTMTLAQAQLKDFALSNDGAVPTVDLTFQCHNSTLTTQTDAVKFVMN